jgi:ComF family protein
MSILARASRLALDLVYPPRCAICHAGGALLCDACSGGLPIAADPRCGRCWMPVARGIDLCRHCAHEPSRFASLRTAYVMEEGARRLAHELKYEGMTALAEPMALLMGQRIDIGGADVVVPVPLHRGRERSRGYNQAALLAKHLAASTGVACDPGAVRRVRATRPLVKTMSRDERRRIMAGAFEARRERIEGRAVVIVDDVCTTGATLDACAAALLDAGASWVRAVAWARAD